MDLPKPFTQIKAWTDIEYVLGHIVVYSACCAYTDTVGGGVR